VDSVSPREEKLKEKSEWKVERSGRGLWYALELMIPLALPMISDFIRPDANY
jgi:hypothetical protein